MGEIGKQLVDDRHVSARKPWNGPCVDVGQAGRIPAEKRAPVRELLFDEPGAGAKLRLGMFEVDMLEVHVRKQLLPVAPERLGPARAVERDRDVETRTKVGVGPLDACVPEARAAVRKERRLWKTPLELTSDALRVDIHVGADLQHRRAAVSAGQHDEIVLWRQHWRLHGLPGKPLDAPAS